MKNLFDPGSLTGAWAHTRAHISLLRFGGTLTSRVVATAHTPTVLRSSTHYKRHEHATPPRGRRAANRPRPVCGPGSFYAGPTIGGPARPSSSSYNPTAAVFSAVLTSRGGESCWRGRRGEPHATTRPTRRNRRNRRSPSPSAWTRGTISHTNRAQRAAKPSGKRANERTRRTRNMLRRGTSRRDPGNRTPRPFSGDGGIAMARAVQCRLHSKLRHQSKRQGLRPRALTIINTIQ